MKSVNVALEEMKLAVTGLGGFLKDARDFRDWWNSSPISMEEGTAIEEKDRFDARFFQMTIQEAAEMHPAELDFLEASWTALQTAGCTRGFGRRIWIYADSKLIQHRTAARLTAALSSLPFTIIHGNSLPNMLLDIRVRLNGSLNDVVMCATLGSKGVGTFVISPWNIAERKLLSIAAVLCVDGEHVRIDTDGQPSLIELETVMPAQPRAGELLMLAAGTSSALEVSTDLLVGYLNQHVDANLGDVAYSLHNMAASLPERRILVSSGIREAVGILQNRDACRYWDSSCDASTRKLVFMFSGLGDHYENMGRDIYEQEPIFRDTVNVCCEFLQPILGFDLREKLYPVRSAKSSGGGEQLSTVPELDIRRILRRDSPETAGEQRESTSWAHPALFTVEYALARLLESWGIKPHVLIGHSLGEYTAACIAGVFTLEQALTIVAKRSQLINGLEKGAMLAVSMTASEVSPLLPEGTTIALMNSPGSQVISGTAEGIGELERRLARMGEVSVRIPSDRAFHSPMMEPAASALSALIFEHEPKPPSIPFLSNVTGTWITAEQATDPGYWADHLCRTVRFSDGINEVIHDRDALFVEIGPGQSLCSFVRQHPSATDGERLQTIPTMRYAYERASDRLFLLRTIGQLWLNGVDFCADAFYRKGSRHLPLPTYPFERMPLTKRSRTIKGG